MLTCCRITGDTAVPPTTKLYVNFTGPSFILPWPYLHSSLHCVSTTTKGDVSYGPINARACDIRRKFKVCTRAHKLFVSPLPSALKTRSGWYGQRQTVGLVSVCLRGKEQGLGIACDFGTEQFLLLVAITRWLADRTPLPSTVTV